MTPFTAAAVNVSQTVEDTWCFRDSECGSLYQQATWLTKVVCAASVDPGTTSNLQYTVYHTAPTVHKEYILNLIVSIGIIVLAERK